MHNLSAFEEFSNELMEIGFEDIQTDLDSATKYKIGSIYENVVNFLESNKLINSSESFESIDKGTNALNESVTIHDIGAAEILNLVDACKIPASYRVAAAQSVANVIEIYRSPNPIGTYFSKVDNNASKIKFDGELRDISDIYSAEMIANEYHEEPMTSLESFGIDSKNTIIDAKIAIAISILKFHQGIMPRFLPNRATSSNIVIYNVERLELYDFNKSSADTAQERYNSDHRIPFVEIYGNPTEANTEAQPIIPKEANDTSADYVFQDGYLNIGKTANLFDLAKDASQPGYDYVDYTDLVSSGSKLESIVLRVQYDDGGGTTYDEFIEVNVADQQGSRFTMNANASDASDRMCNLDFPYFMSNSQAKMDGTTSNIMQLFDNNHLIKVDITANGKINLKTSYINVLGTADASCVTVDGTTPLPAMVAIFNDTDISVVAYKIKATYNEENLRKTTRSLRILNKPIGYEIPGTKNVQVVYSLLQPKPDTVINGLSNLLRVGNDDRGVKVILDCMTNVYNRIQQEKMSYVPYEKKVLNSFVAGNQVIPFIYQDTITISSEVDSMRSAEKLADTRGLVELKLLQIFTLIHNQSYFLKALPPGTRPEYKILTSGFILDALLNVPYYTTIVDQSPAEKAADGVNEYKRILPNNTQIDIITSNFDYLSDKMIIVPYLSQSPQSELNFGTLFDRGSFIVSFVAYQNRAAANEIIANTREFPIVTNPIGAILTVSGISHIFEGVANLGV